MMNKIDHILGVNSNGSDSRAKAIGRWAFVFMWLGLCALSLIGLLSGIHELCGPVEIEIRVEPQQSQPATFQVMEQNR